MSSVRLVQKVKQRLKIAHTQAKSTVNLIISLMMGVESVELVEK